MIDPSHAPWRLRMGANVTDGGVEFRVWAPHANTIDVTLGQAYIPLTRGDDGVWSGIIPETGPGTRYRYRVDGVWSFPDPYSRSQPDGPHEPSCVVDPAAYTWSDANWRGTGIA